MLQRVHLALEFLGLLKLFSRRGNAHLFVERFYQLLLLAFKQKGNVADIAPVLLFCDCTAAYARTQPYLCAEARPLLPKSTFISVRKNLSNEPHCFQKLKAVRKRAKSVSWYKNVLIGGVGVVFISPERRTFLCQPPPSKDRKSTRLTPVTVKSR